MAYIVNTDKMSAEYNGALIEGTLKAKVAMDNGMLVERDGVTGDFKFATDKSVEDLYLVTTPEKLYEGSTLGGFTNAAGKVIRAFKLVDGDEFSTNANADVAALSVGDKLMAGAANGMFIASDASEAVSFTVIEKKNIGATPVVTLRVSK